MKYEEIDAAVEKLVKQKKTTVQSVGKKSFGPDKKV
jgi:hypothetical protein